MKIGEQGSRDWVILRTGRNAPIGLRYYLAVRIPFLKCHLRRHPNV